MKIIFLDIDGVLNNQAFLKTSQGFGENQLDPRNVAVLNKIVGATGAKIVISSSWRHIWDHEQIAKMMAKVGFTDASCVIDRTPVGENNRGMEVQEWVQLDAERMIVNPDHQSIEAWVILDDVDEFLPEQKPHFVQTNPQTGLTGHDASEAISILRMGR